MRYYETARHNIAAAVVLPLANIIAVGLRFWVRTKQKQPLKVDDWLLIPATFMTIGIGILMLYGVFNEALGHNLILPEGYTDSIFLIQTDQLELSGKLEWAHDLMFPLALGCTKASLLFFYLRIFSVNKRSNSTLFLKALIVLIAIWSVAFFFAALFTCKIDFEAIWGPTINLFTICTNSLGKLLALCFTDFFADVVIITFPIPLIWRLNLSRGRKVGVSAIFLLGVVTIAASLARLIIVAQVAFAGFVPTEDEILLVTLEIYWAMIEVGVGVFVACLPSLAVLFKDLTWEGVTTRAGNLLQHARWGSRSLQTDESPTSLGCGIRLYDIDLPSVTPLPRYVLIMLGQPKSTLERSDSIDSFEEVNTKIIKASNPESNGVLRVDGKVPSVLHVLKYIGFNDHVVECRQSLTPFKRIPQFKEKDTDGDIQIGDYGEGDDDKPVLDITYKISKPSNDYRRQDRSNPNERPITAAFDLNDYRYDDGDYEDESQAAATSPTKPAITMNIHSQYLIHALQAVISYYPRVNLQDSPVSIPAPYRLLYLHRAELACYRDNQPNSHSPGHAETTARHIDVLLQFLAENMGDTLTKEEALHKMTHPSATFDLFWLLLKPGQIIYGKRYGLWTPYVISAVRAGSSNPFTSYKVDCWYLESNGVVVKRYMETFRVQPWTGEQTINSLPVIPEAFWVEDDTAQSGKTMRERCIEEGRLYWELLKKPTYMEYDGQLVNPSSGNGQCAGPTGKLCGRVICDPVGFDRFYTASPDFNSSGRPSLNSSRQGSPLPPPLDHLPRSLPRCGCDACDKSRDPTQGNDGPYAEFRDLDATCDSPPKSEVFYHVLSKVIPSFIPNSRRWACALIGKLANEAEGRLLPWNTDFLQNKGEGRIFLLHGTPGVGKTSTAECIAEATNRPLIAITSGDLGVDAYRVESSLNYFLDLGQRYGALLLLDEADVYLERRRSKDITRNGLVSTFLRALEYYRGVLFLTTNRVQAFDSAFLSRIHVALHYKNLRDEDRERIWANTFERLHRESNGTIRISTAARNLLLGSANSDNTDNPIRSLKWNGREIRNAMQMMLAMAESEAREEGSKVVTVGQKHVSAVVDLSGDFRDYLKKTTPVEGILDVEVEGDDSD
ncbi:hypothetical protein NUW58_g2548 [Xylaria curta]|uniref:Uncharacterized protein n=1 Tax=Xylaria curta TaxID=42375 RepID=A0ACC1PGS3_9PEZI|nr:hypothetical protein NUW58_g2548 [Xylaria curta]